MNKAVLRDFAIESRKDLMDKIKTKLNMFYVEENFDCIKDGDICNLSNNSHQLKLTTDEYNKRELLIKRIKEQGIEQVIEEAAYTWFNRLIAIRYMEIHDYLPLGKENESLGIRVLSSKDNTPNPEILKFTNLTNSSLDINFDKDKYAQLLTDNDRYKYVLLLVCNKLKKVFPDVFNGYTEYIDVLIPENMLSDSGFITKMIKEVDEENFDKVEIIGWLYQYYISEKKDEVFLNLKKNIKIKKENIPAATQIFTPDWIVKYMVENTLGRYTSLLFRKNLKYYVENKKDLIVEQNIEQIKFLDPCCGSGHILVYAFELFYKIYEYNGYNKNDIPQLILKNNIYGLDVDDRAGQLAILSVTLKAREYDKNIFNKDLFTNINISSIQETNSISEEALDGIKSETNKKIAIYLFNKFKNAKDIGSLLLLDNFDYTDLKDSIIRDDTIFGIELQRLLPIIKNAEILSGSYDVVVTNPPYMGNRGMNTLLSEYVKKYYANYKTDLFSAFIKQVYNLTKEYGYYAMITQPTFLFISSFEKVRDDLINKNSIISLLHMGRGIFGIDFGSCSFVVKKETNIEYCGSYYRLNKRTFQYIDVNDIEKMYLMAKNNPNYKFDFNKYKSNIDDEANFEYGSISNESGILQVKFETVQSNFNEIPGKPFAYWASKNILSKFKNEKKLGDIAAVKIGMGTGDNELFLRKWWEVNNTLFCCCISCIDELDKSKYKWVPYNKGGDYRLWYGNLLEIIWYDKEGRIALKNTSGHRENGGQEYYFKKGITWSFISSSNFSVRSRPFGSVFDVAGSTMFIDDSKYNYMLGLLSSKICGYILNMLNPTLNFQAGNIKSIPICFKPNKDINQFVDENIEISKEDWDSFETSWDFKKHPLIEYKSGSGYDKDIDKWDYRIKDAYNSWESNCDAKFNLLKQNEEKLNDIFIKIYGLQDELTPEVKDKDITIRRADREREIKSLISYAVGCMFGRYSLDESGLIFAGGNFDINRYKLYKPDVDNIIPISDSKDLYYNDDIVSRFVEFIEAAYGKGSLSENLDYIAETLGKKGTESSEDTIRRYFVNDFYNDHVKMYQKRPIYWMFDSGKKNGFKCLIYLHRYDKQLVSRIRVNYLHRTQETYERLFNETKDKLDNTSISTQERKILQTTLSDLNNKITELNNYYEKIAHLADQMLDIDLDDGVKVNYAKFEDVLAKIK